jgi:Bacterial mobilisation protein (MobC)
MQKPKRAKSIKIRVTEEELSAMRERSDRAQLADWLRDLALGQTKRKPVPQADPALLRQLAAIGNNLNQLAKWVNSAKPASALPCAAALVALGRELEAIRAHQDSQ